jgi:hypothetical protein
MRIHLANEVAELINDFGPKVYENFDEVGSSSVGSRYDLKFLHRLVFLCPLLRRLHLAVQQDYGDEPVAQAPWMLKGWGWHTL